MLLALTREVPESISRCELTHLSRSPIDLEIARRQHKDYEEALANADCTIRRLPAADDLPDSVFVEDTAVVLDEVAVITRPGAPSRRPETASVAAALREHRELLYVEAPATVDGGDILRVGRTIFVGQSSRTNAAGFSRLFEALPRYGYSVFPLTPLGCLHLKSAVTAFADDGIVMNPEWVHPAFFSGLRIIHVDPSEPFAANVLRVGEVVLCAAAFPRAAQRLRTGGMDVRIVDMSELAKAEGALTCCSITLTTTSEG